VRLWDRKAKSVLAVGDPVKDNISKIAISPDGQKIAALYPKGKLVVRDADLGVSLHERDIAKLSEYYNLVEFSRSGAELVLDTSNSIFALDAMTGHLLWQIKINTTVAARRELKDGSFILLQNGSSQEVHIRRLDRKSTSPLSEPLIVNGHLS